MHKIAHWFDMFWNWIVYSSTHPDKISSTIKWAGGVCITLLTVVFGFGHLSFPTQEATVLIDSTIQGLQTILLGITTLGTVVAGIRKIILTIKGENVKVNP